MESRKDNTIAVIPSYNEGRTIENIVRSIASMGISSLVIDDGSSDDTSSAALKGGAMVFRHEKNLGKGLAVREGIKYVLGKTNFEWMIILDGDGQHHVEDIPALMAATAGGQADFVIGNRMLQTKTMPFVRLCTNKFMSWVVSGMCKQDIPDTQCGTG